MKTKTLLAAMFFAALLFSTPAYAIPHLQLYIDGAVYDPVTDTWTTTAPVFDLWIIGDVEKKGSLSDVHLAMAFFGAGGSLSLTPKTTLLLTDPSIPDAPWLDVSGTGLNPPLVPHGIYNDPDMDHWENWSLGDFTLEDSPVGDFITSYPTEFPFMGQINVYEVSMSGWDRVHFDAFGKKLDKDVTAPYSHDARGTHTHVPEPSTLLLLGAGLAGLGLWGRKRIT